MAWFCNPISVDYGLIFAILCVLLITVILYRTSLGFMVRSKVPRLLIQFGVFFLVLSLLVLFLALSPTGELCINGLGNFSYEVI